MVIPGGLSGPPHSNMAPPQSVTSKPRWSRYQTPRRLGSADLKNMPPMPVTRFIVFLLRSTSARSAVERTAAADLPPLKVKREEGQDGHPDLVPLRGHVQPNEGCTPRELNALKLHRCCPVKPLPAKRQVRADSFATGGNASLAQAQSHD